MHREHTDPHRAGSKYITTLRIALRQVLEQHDKRADEFILAWKQDRVEHGDRNNFDADTLDFD